MIEEEVWDSVFFGRKIGRLNSVPAGNALRKYLQQAAANGYAYLTCRIVLEKISEIQHLEKHGFYVTDIGAVWERKAGPIPEPSILVREANLKDGPLLRKISRGLFKDGRFYNDPFFTCDEAEKLYRAWIDGSLNDKDVKTFVVVKKGFITCKRLSRNKGDIPLVGVIAGEQGKGIGSSLVNKALDWFKKTGIKTVTVRTQANNIRAMNFYKGLGFSVKYVDVTMGKMLKEEIR